MPYFFLQYLFHSVADCYLDVITEQSSISLRSFEKLSHDISQVLNEFFVAKLCGVIETRLRLDVHSSLQILQADTSDPFDHSLLKPSNSIAIEDMCRLLGLKLISMFQLNSMELDPSYRHLSIRNHVSKYLSQMFYNLTTISMHDWRTYGQMRILAKKKFHLDTVEDHLPTQTLEQGLDVLEIMRNIHLFVSNYLYNLNNQIFIEKCSKNKHLNTINIRHIANSLRTHGIGSINTTVSIAKNCIFKKMLTIKEHILSNITDSTLNVQKS